VLRANKKIIIIKEAVRVAKFANKEEKKSSGTRVAKNKIVPKSDILVDRFCIKSFNCRY